jgi:outer membrane protein assembly factor BamB
VTASFSWLRPNGDIRALQADSGAELWRTQAGSPISAGVGSDGRYTSVVTRGNEVVTFDSRPRVLAQARAFQRGDAAAGGR